MRLDSEAYARRVVADAQVQWELELAWKWTPAKKSVRLAHQAQRLAAEEKGSKAVFPIGDGCIRGEVLSNEEGGLLLRLAVDQDHAEAPYSLGASLGSGQLGLPP